MTSNPGGARGVPLERHLVVVGMMASGKTTTAGALADALGAPFVDNDVELETAASGTGRDIATRDGVDTLHQLEMRVLLGHLDRVQPTVIAAAASVVDSPECRTAMAERSTVCWLDIPVEELAQRLGLGRHRRRMDEAELRGLHARRFPLFETVADVRVSALEPLDERIRSIVAHLQTRP